MLSALKYRSDIDGLRAVAVLSVVLFHLSKSALPGGYLGVDIFFVVSGFLITTIIWREQTAGNFSIVNFYERRTRRIAPALAAMMAAVSVMTLFVLLPLDLVGYARSVLATLVFSSNIYFWRDTDYFSRLAEEKPLLHTWSLGIEEQFYVLFPLVVSLCVRLRPNITVIVILLLSGASFAANLLFLKVGKAIPAFYLLPMRAWELGIGAFIAVLPTHPATRRSTATAVSWVGLALVAVSLTVKINGLWGSTIMRAGACIGAAALIFGGQYAEGTVQKLMSARPLVLVGLISYSLYLWHWPLIVLPKYYLVRELSFTESMLVVTAAVVAASLSWRFVEQPFRSKQFSRAHIFGFSLAISSAMALWAGITITQGGFPDRLSRDAATINSAVGANYRCAVSEYISFGALAACGLELPSRNPRDAHVIVLGDSHAQMYAPVIRALLTDKHDTGLLVPANGCLPMTEPNLGYACSQIAEENLAAIETLREATVVVIAFNWDFASKTLVFQNEQPLKGDAEEHVLAGLDKSIARLTGAGKQVVLVGPIAIPGFDIASIVGRKTAFHHPIDVPLSSPKTEFMARWQDVFAHYSHRTDVRLIRPDRVQCAAEKCEYFLDGRSLFADTNHLVASEAMRFRSEFEEALGGLMGRSPTAE